MPSVKPSFASFDGGWHYFIAEGDIRGCCCCTVLSRMDGVAAPFLTPQQIPTFNFFLYICSHLSRPPSDLGLSVVVPERDACTMKLNYTFHLIRIMNLLLLLLNYYCLLALFGE